MIDIRTLRESPDIYRRAAEVKRMRVDIDRILGLDQRVRPMQQDLEALQSQRNQMSKTIGLEKDAARRDSLRAEVTQIKAKMEGLEQDIASAKAELQALLLLVPAPPRDDVPLGVDDSQNVEVRRWGEPKRDPGFVIKDHVALATHLGILDIERGVRLAGSRSFVLRGAGAMLEQAVLRLTWDLLVRRGFEPCSIPVLVKEDAMVGTGYFPTGREQAYLVERDELVLVGTAEVSLTSLHRDEILQEDQLPIKVFAQSACFRREAGTYGKDTHGLYRVHQFQKIEQVIVGAADAALSEQYHDELLANAEAVLQALNLPYRVVYVCTGDLGQGQVRKHDIETWMPSRQAYSETHSCSTFHEFQARRLQLRYRDKQGQVRYCHTLNNTAIATPRVLIPLLECYQDADGSVRVPEVLQGYMGGLKKIERSGSHV